MSKDNQQDITKPSAFKSRVLGRLKKVIDPELGINIVDLGLIYQIKLKTNISKLKTTAQNLKLEQDHELDHTDKVLIVMTLTTPGCPLAPEFVTMIKEELSQLEGLKESQIEVEFTFEPPWHQGMMSEEARAQLGFN